MKKLLVIGREGRIIKYAPEPDRLKEYDIVYAPVGARDEELLTKGKDADFILVDAIGSISGNVIRQMANLKLIHSEGVGYQGVDLDAAKECGVYVCNCKGVNASAGGAGGAPDAGCSAGCLRRRPERPGGKTDRNQGAIYD